MSRSCLPTSGSAGMLSGIFWTFAQGPVLLRPYAYGLLGLQVPVTLLTQRSRCKALELAGHAESGDACSHRQSVLAACM